MFKKSGIGLSYCNWQPFYPTTVTSKTSLLQPQPQHLQYRSYAIVSDGHSRHDHGKLRWPEITSNNMIPTPYQIFNQKKSSPYSKERFYELVKLYHPDRHELESLISELPQEIKVERYRLIVAANNILSDPVKRRAYDLYGAGWNGQPDPAGARPHPHSPGAYSGWDGPNGPSQNATWEDWERWYQRDSKGPQEPRYVSNTAFVGLILTFAVLGGIGQATRAGNYSMSFLEQRDALHDSVSKELIRRRQESTSFGNRDQRIQSFLKSRDQVGYGVSDLKEEGYRKFLPTPEICSSEDVKQQRIGVYNKKEEPKGG